MVIIEVRDIPTSSKITPLWGGPKYVVEMGYWVSLKSFKLLNKNTPVGLTDTGLENGLRVIL